MWQVIDVAFREEGSEVSKRAFCSLSASCFFLMANNVIKVSYKEPSHVFLVKFFSELKPVLSPQTRIRVSIQEDCEEILVFITDVCINKILATGGSSQLQTISPEQS